MTVHNNSLYLLFQPEAGRCQYHRVPVAPAGLRLPPAVGPPAALLQEPPPEKMTPSCRAVRVLSGLGVAALLTGLLGLATHQIIYDAILDKVFHTFVPQWVTGTLSATYEKLCRRGFVRSILKMNHEFGG